MFLLSILEISDALEKSPEVLNSFIRGFNFYGGTIPLFVLIMSSIKRFASSKFFSKRTRAFGAAYGEDNMDEKIEAYRKAQDAKASGS